MLRKGFTVEVASVVTPCQGHTSVLVLSPISDGLSSATLPRSRAAPVTAGTRSNMEVSSCSACMGDGRRDRQCLLSQRSVLGPINRQHTRNTVSHACVHRYTDPTPCT